MERRYRVCSYIGLVVARLSFIINLLSERNQISDSTVRSEEKNGINRNADKK